MVPVLTVTLIVTSFLVVLFVLLHRGKGGGLSSMFGGGGGSNLTGSSIAEKNLDRFTVAVSLIWTASVIGLGLLMKTV
ncbi:MAG: preprotein translocase subunit SecG [Mycobacteriales bacterium]